MNSLQNRTKICLYSDPNFLSLSILELLLSKDCFIVVATNEVDKWKEKTRHIRSTDNFEIVEKNKVVKINYNYVIFSEGFFDVANTFKELQKYSRNEIFKDTKTLALIPLEAFEKEVSDSLRISDNSAIIYLGDVIGPRIDLEGDLLISKTVKQVFTGYEMKVGVGEVYYPIFIDDVVRTVIKWLFSFGPYGHETFLLGEPTTSTQFWVTAKKINPKLELMYGEQSMSRKIPANYEIQTIKCNLTFALSETAKWYMNNMNKSLETQKVKVKKEKVKTEKQKEETVRKVVPLKTISLSFNKIKASAFILVALLIFPLVMFLVPLTINYAAYKSFIKGNYNVEGSLGLSKQLFKVTKGITNVYKKIPLLGFIYNEVNYASSIGFTVSESVANALPVLNETDDILQKILGNEPYDINNYSSSISQLLGYLSGQLSSIRDVTIVYQEENSLYAKKLAEKVDFQKYVRTMEEVEKLATLLPQTLDNKEYLILFQNNMELRPTGGFIGSYGVVSFENGRMNQLNINDIYSADGQLKGHVEPPEPILKYLDEANWWFRDSNWDPDFPTSAKRAEWFLDKETDQQVDGVIAVDLNLIKDFLAVTEDIFLPDYNMEINGENLYEKTQEEVHLQFFPGSHKKASFLTALSRSLLTELTKVEDNKKALVMKALYDNLEERHIQVYLHDEEFQKSISSAGWSGEILPVSCGENCLADMVSSVEANLGVNKANYFISRENNLNVQINDKNVSKKLSITYKNSANTALGPSGRYKAYVRFLVPEKAISKSVILHAGETTEKLEPDVTTLKGRQEVGVLIEILPGQARSLEFEWETPIEDKITSYGLYLRKQAGTDSDFYSVHLNKSGEVLSANPRFSLTEAGGYTYNINLSKDFVSQILW